MQGIGLRLCDRGRRGGGVLQRLGLGGIAAAKHAAHRAASQQNGGRGGNGQAQDQGRECGHQQVS
ncbi:MAG: hypothetical protein MO852_01765 [Candidatus Devosia euplotis]|nr:hypothetical protein [Candidatus Devosia euplotis]